MNLCGRLSLTTLGDLLGSLYRSQARGTLELIEDKGPFSGRVHRLHLDDGRLRFIESPLGAEKLGELLVGRRFISRALHCDLLTRLEADPTITSGKYVTDSHWVEPRVVGQVVHEQTSRRLIALFQLRDARVAFRVARPESARIVGNVPLTAEEFLHRSPRARDRQDTPERPTAFDDSMARPVDSHRRRALLVLGLPPHANTTDVKLAFRRIASRLHPDRHLVAPENQRELLRQRFAQVTQAYHLLTG